VNTHNPVIKLCIEGTQAEFKGQHEDAHTLYWQAWEIAQNDYEACIAAHYVARLQQKPEDILFWNLEALNRADHVQPELVKDFYPSLYLNMGRAYELLGNASEAQKYYDLAAKLGFKHQED
jgi:tetratricopeptide (TPR) repeat protein